MYCNNCGAMIAENTQICVKCGQPIPQPSDPPVIDARKSSSNGLSYLIPIAVNPVSVCATWASIFSLCVPLLAPVGIILGIIAINIGKKESNPNDVKRGVWAIVISSIILLLMIFYVAAMLYMPLFMKIR